MSDNGSDMVELVLVFFWLLLPVFFIIAGYVVGSLTQGAHLRNLESREEAVRDMLLTDFRRFPGDVQAEPTPTLVLGEACIATDYWKSFASKIRKIFGGEMKSYQSLVDRARREATLRMLEDARARGYNAVCNLRLETVDIGGAAMSNQRVAVTISMLASGTAYRVAEQAPR